MKKDNLGYKIGLAVIGLFVVGLAIFVIMQANSTKQDTQTDKAANNISNKLNTYVSTYERLPSSLDVTGVKSVPQAISYKILNNNKYKFCIMYKTTSSGFDASDAVFNTATGNSIDTTPDSYVPTSSLYIPPTHHKGAFCQVIKPNGLTQTFNYVPGTEAKSAALAAGDQTSSCGVNKYQVHYSGVIQSIATVDGSKLVPTADQKIIVKVKPNGNSPSGIQSITISPAGTAPESEFFNVSDSSCTGREATGMKAGDNISVFLKNAEPNMPNWIIDFSQ